MMDQTRQKDLGVTAHMQNAHKKGEAKGFSFYLRAMGMLQILPVKVRSQVSAAKCSEM